MAEEEHEYDGYQDDSETLLPLLALCLIPATERSFDHSIISQCFMHQVCSRLYLIPAINDKVSPQRLVRDGEIDPEVEVDKDQPGQHHRN